MESIVFQGRPPIIPLETVPREILRYVRRFKPEKSHPSDDIFFCIKTLLEHPNMGNRWRRLHKKVGEKTEVVFSLILEAYRKRKAPLPTSSGWNSTDRKRHLISIATNALKLRELLTFKRYNFVLDLIDEGADVILLSHLLGRLAKAASDLSIKSPRNRGHNALFPDVMKFKKVYKAKGMQRAFFRTLCAGFCQFLGEPLDDFNSEVSCLLFPHGNLTLTYEDIRKNTQNVRKRFYRKIDEKK